jgi:hypothetical protein
MADTTTFFCRSQWPRGLRALAHTGFLPESDPAPVVEFFTRTGITAAGGQFDFERCTRKMFVQYIEIGSAQLVGFIQTEGLKTVVQDRQVQTRVQVPMHLH